MSERGDFLRRLRGALLLALLFALLGCSSSEPHKADGRVEREAGSSGGTGGARPDAGDDSRDTIDAADALPSDAPILPVRVGLVPVPATTSDAGATTADETRAHAEVVAAGARAVTLTRSWSELFSTATTPNLEALSRLRAARSYYRDAGVDVLLCLGLVDRQRMARPSALGGSWQSAEVVRAAEQLIDETFAGAGTELAYLALGVELDRYLTILPSVERDGFQKFVLHALDYARRHPSRPSRTRVGVTLSSDAIISSSLPELAALIAASDVAIASYYPIDQGFVARAPSRIAADLEALSASVSSDAGPSPIVLQEVGFPSAESAGGSLEKQKLFFDGLFAALEMRRDRFPFVSVYALNDERAARCEAEAMAYGAPGDPKAIAFLCSLGVRGSGAAPKPAWVSVLGGLATFRAP